MPAISSPSLAAIKVGLPPHHTATRNLTSLSRTIVATTPDTTMLPSVTLALCSLLGFIGIASASLPDTYTVVDVQWDLLTDLNNPNSAAVSVFGTIQEAVAQMEAQFPGWNATFQAQQPSYSTVSDGTVSAAALYDRDYYLCGGPVKDGIACLRKVTTAAPKNGPGPNNCARVSCGYNAAIYWCNDNDKEKELESWGSIADGVEYIYGECTVGADINRLVAWQIFYKNKWNVILTKEWC
ncbi:hypothetical protein QC763_611385 [Podospora pseudopauciseta]|uniref:Secreted protein n=1 Tax=Podospora pseudopauciseta TaxID=2093780 RepID=A0ABR0H343_9PEZI|nr:hypothetical protein QC763_611385 [Podospora pseudopauciseta]